ncbi:hypothetical protein L7F22_060130 [Adiantum nelumboides]|nr:hypothetical protein [Adiantum nelumboides]
MDVAHNVPLAIATNNGANPSLLENSTSTGEEDIVSSLPLHNLRGAKRLARSEGSRKDKFLNPWMESRDMLHPLKENIDPQMAKHSYSSLIAPDVAKEMLDVSKFKKVKQNIINDFIQDTTIDTLDVQSVIDDCGISQKGYSSIFKSVKSQLRSRKVASSVLPLPAHVCQARQGLNNKVSQYLGDSYFINE